MTLRQKTAPAPSRPQQNGQYRHSQPLPVTIFSCFIRFSFLSSLSQIPLSKLRGMTWLVLSAPRGRVFDPRGIRQISARARLPGSLLAGIKKKTRKTASALSCGFFLSLLTPPPFLNKPTYHTGASPPVSRPKTLLCKSPHPSISLYPEAFPY